MPEDLALVAVETVLSVLRTKPNEPVVVLHNIGDSDLGESRIRFGLRDRRENAGWVGTALIGIPPGIGVGICVPHGASIRPRLAGRLRC